MQDLFKRDGVKPVILWPVPVVCLIIIKTETLKTYFPLSCLFALYIFINWNDRTVCSVSLSGCLHCHTLSKRTLTKSAPFNL